VGVLIRGSSMPPPPDDKAPLAVVALVIAVRIESAAKAPADKAFKRLI
jgi:hypothetical protein